MAKAKLIKGQDYVVKGMHFRKGIALTVDDELKEYLSANSQFEIIEEEQQDPDGDNGDPQETKKATGTKGKGKQQEGDE